MVCVVDGTQLIAIKWKTNATNSRVDTYGDVVVVQDVQEHLYVKCITRNEFGYQERNISIGKSKHIAIQLLTVLSLTIAPIVPIKHRGHAYHFDKVNEPVLIPCTSEGTVDVFEWYELLETTLRFVPIDLDKYELLDNGNTLKVMSAETRGFDFLCIAKNVIETIEGTFVVWIDDFP